MMTTTTAADLDRQLDAELDGPTTARPSAVPSGCRLCDLVLTVETIDGPLTATDRAAAVALVGPCDCEREL